MEWNNNINVMCMEVYKCDQDNYVVGEVIELENQRVRV